MTCRASAAAGLIACLAALAPFAALAQSSEVTLPDTVTVTAYGTESSSYAQGVGISNMLSERYNSSFRIIPGKNDVSRMLLLQTGRAEFCMCGISAYFAQEGIEFFAEQGSGPIPVRLLMAIEGSMHMGLGAAADAGIETPADLKGKRVAYVQGGPANNRVVESTLAYGGLTWDDVERVEFPGFGAAVEGVINGQVDAAAMNTSAGVVERLNSSPRGLAWPQTPEDDAAAWEQLHRVAPYITYRRVTDGIGVPEGGMDGNGLAFPFWVTLPETDADLAYNLTKAMIEGVDGFVDAAPQAEGYALDRQRLLWQMPYHEGAIRFFKEMGMWGEEEEAHNQKLLERQQVLNEAWDSMLTFEGSDEEFQQKWFEVRATALEAGGFDVVN